MGDLGDRMKAYETVATGTLMRKTPVLLRMDGRAFHTLTRGMERPFDETLAQCMDCTALELVESIQGARLAYVQSDEISILLIDYERLESEPWFGYETQKVTSIAASMTTAHFGRWFRSLFPQRAGSMPMFDARCFNLPHHDVVNYFIWRQQDATRNSVSMAAQAEYSPKQLHGKKNADMQDMLMAVGVNWNDYPTRFKRGMAFYKRGGEIVSDLDMPILTADRDYINRHVYPELLAVGNEAP